MATLKQVVDVLETLYPLRYAEQWDEPGLIVGDLRQPVRGIAFAADPSMAVVDQAIAGGVDLLVCHHRCSSVPFMRCRDWVSVVRLCVSSILPDVRCGWGIRMPMRRIVRRHGCG